MVPVFNEYWAKYGCTKCNDYKLLVMSVNFNEWEDRFTQWMHQYNCTHPGVCSNQGGRDLIKAVNGVHVGGRQHLIHPDKTVTNAPSARQINDAGGNVQHVCGTAIHVEKKKKERAALSIFNVTKNSFSLKILRSDVYSISFYSANGKLKAIVARKLSAGSQTIALERGVLANGVYIIEIKDSYGISRVKVVLE